MSGASTVRGAGNKGAVAASRAFLRRLNLARFGVTDATIFSTELDRTTDALRSALPRNAQHWGLARKVLNIFLRDCFYTSYLVSAFHLDRAERFLELPLDSITAKQLTSVVGRGGLPSWRGVKQVTKPSVLCKNASWLNFLLVTVSWRNYQPNSDRILSEVSRG